MITDTSGLFIVIPPFYSLTLRRFSRNPSTHLPVCHLLPQILLSGKDFNCHKDQLDIQQKGIILNIKQIQL